MIGSEDVALTTMDLAEFKTPAYWNHSLSPECKNPRFHKELTITSTETLELTSN